jgi:hypothetical protein
MESSSTSYSSSSSSSSSSSLSLSLPMLDILKRWRLVRLLCDDYCEEHDMRALACSCRPIYYLITSFTQSSTIGINYLCSTGKHRPSFAHMSLQSVLPASIPSEFAAQLQELTVVPDYSHFYLFYLGPSANWGLHTESLIPVGSVVLSYVGEYISSAERQRRHASRNEGEVCIMCSFLGQRFRSLCCVSRAITF